MKNIYILLILFCFVSAKAQDTTQAEAPKKKSTADIIPAAGDIAIGAEATPYLNYLGNMLSSAGTNTLALGSPIIYVRYHLTETNFIRAKFFIQSETEIARNYVTDDAALFANPLSQTQVEDKQTKTTNGYAVGVAYLISRGYGRLRGYYGAQIGYDFARTTCKYQYGNDITVENNTPNTTNFTVTPLAFAPTAERTLESDNGYDQGLGAGLVAGVEYFFMPKICIGGEVNLNYSYRWTSQGDITNEKLVGSKVETFDKIGPQVGGMKSSKLNTVRPGTYGCLYLMFHF